MIRPIFAVILLLAVAGCAGSSGSSSVRGSDGVVPERELADTTGVRFRHIDAINALRLSRGIPELSYSQALNSAALTHARDMALQQRAWHFGSDRSNPQSRATSAGFGGRVLGENIAEAFDGDIEILQNWPDQPGASALILNPDARAIGFAWFQEPTGKIWWVQMFGTTGLPAQQVF